MQARTEYSPLERRTDLTLTVHDDELTQLLRRYQNVILDRVVEQVADAIVSSAAVQARISAMRAELPTRIEEAVTAAVAASILKSR